MFKLLMPAMAFLFLMTSSSWSMGFGSISGLDYVPTNLDKYCEPAYKNEVLLPALDKALAEFDKPVYELKNLDLEAAFWAIGEAESHWNHYWPSGKVKLSKSGGHAGICQVGWSWGKNKVVRKFFKDKWGIELPNYDLTIPSDNIKCMFTMLIYCYHNHGSDPAKIFGWYNSGDYGKYGYWKSVSSAYYKILNG